MSNSLTIERRNKLAQILIAEGSVKVGKIAEMFGVSTETIRKDLIYLDKKGIATKGHGGAIASGNILAIEQPLAQKTHEHLQLKEQIAQLAIQLIPDRGVVILDTGSTVQCVANALMSRSKLTIISNAINAIHPLSQTDNDVFLVGGKLHPNSQALVGMWGINAFKSINADVVFLGTDGLKNRNGPCTASYEEAELKAAMVKSARLKVVVSDSTKFSSSGLFQFCDWSEIDYFITDPGIPEEELSHLSKLTEVIVIDKPKLPTMALRPVEKD
ncbi:DeoR/GlpR family DNA-binding transcription regulator [Citrobacter sp. ESY80]|uniref:DeoR/GlpR family DNA-binding transcription regulator n=1 Tax=Citrobacter braakii TaxID=57706 RepID=UPI000E156958|nr:DeoR/GlpR family DNA-binding transcription regulator [Citrobacter braakii]QXA94176.1 DeoR/GlpR family DNA-binding transcription regulator [Citrobacter braakii]STB40334.1 DNA-binding transcriptional regulator AgaR [Citrobacter braakii]SUX59722.1 DNA-binding transcriptional regulator AgaR [Citrobacter braakii]HCZ8663098.1 DeoR/GlpR transcriptional regulator [Citrobacter braakii]